MSTKFRIAALLASGVALVVGITWFGVASQAEAACGAAVSSCKSCHEVQGKAPVSKKGDWHIQHSFGDFCEFCHGGITKEPTAEKAHQGLRAPLADAQKSCGSCHAPDLSDRVAKYGGSVSGGGAAPVSTGTGTGSGSGNSSAPPPPPPTSGSAAAPVDTTPKDVLDFNRRLQGEPEPPNRGNDILWGLNALAAVALGGTYWLYERKPKVPGVRANSRQAFGEALSGVLPAEHAELIALLGGCDRSTLEALEQVLRQEGGAAFLRRLGRLDLGLIGRLDQLSQEELLLALALARGQKN